MTFFVHPKAICDSDQIGPRTRIWAFAHVLPGAKVGADCNICDGVFIENDVSVGDRVTLKCGTQLWDGLRVEDDVFVGPNVTFTNDPLPRSRQTPDSYTRTIIRRRASIGANATILPGLTIGTNAMVGAGSVVTRDVPANAIVVGNPARVVGFVDALTADVDPMLANGSRLISIQRVSETRGTLVAAEVGSSLPFSPTRVFAISAVPEHELRGAHAHRECHQMLVCLAGSVKVLVEDASGRRVVELSGQTEALYMPPMTWGSQFAHSADSVLLVLASHPYDPDDYIRDYDEFTGAVTVGA